MKVLEEPSKGVSKGTTIAMQPLGLPVKGTTGLLIVFWKGQ